MASLTLDGSISPAELVEAHLRSIPPELNAFVAVREEAYPELWDVQPEAYLRLLSAARLPEVHAFALGAVKERHPLLIRVDGELAGLVLVRPLDGGERVIAEFLILPKYRRRGIGTSAARPENPVAADSSTTRPVIVIPGATMLTRMFSGPSSTARS